MFFFQDVFCLLTPGGGGYGEPISKKSGVEDDPQSTPILQERKKQVFVERGSIYEYRQTQEGA